MARESDKEPFRMFKINDPDILNTIEERKLCRHCFKSRKFFCYSCYAPMIDDKYIPKVKLPIKIDIIKHPKETNGKSTAIHAAVLAPDDVTIYTYPAFPQFSKDEKIILIFPSKDATTVANLFHQRDRSTSGPPNEFPITRAVFIDSTWHQTNAIYKDQRLRDLPCVVLKSRSTQFWRHQKKSPRWYLATIEAIHEFLIELHEYGFGKIDDYATKDLHSETKEYCGQYDNLLYFFRYMYEKIHPVYNNENFWASRRPWI